MLQAGRAARLLKHTGLVGHVLAGQIRFPVPSIQGNVPMSQAELDRQISRLTGESLREVRRRGFSVLSPQPSVFEPDADDVCEPQILDWDHVDAARYGRAA